MCLFIELGIYCALSSVYIYILSTLLFLYGALRAEVRCKRLLHYITYPVARRTACKLLIFPQNAHKATYKKPSSNTLAVTSMATTWNTILNTPRKTAWNGAAT